MTNLVAGQPVGMMVQVPGLFDVVLARVIEALKGEGFGVLTEIDVRETFKQKLDVEFRPYRILGACNPTLAHRALSVAPEVGLLLPCNVTVAQGEGGLIEVGLIDPVLMLSVVQRPELVALAEEVRARLVRVAQALAG